MATVVLICDTNRSKLLDAIPGMTEEVLDGYLEDYGLGVENADGSEIWGMYLVVSESGLVYTETEDRLPSR